MDEIMYEHLKEQQNHQIRYRLVELTLKEPPTTTMSSSMNLSPVANSW